MEENREEVVEQEAQVDQIGPDDMLKYKSALSNAVISITQAERAAAEAKTAQTEAKYVVLSLFMKYNLTPGKDNINEDGKIIRGK